MQKLKNDKGQIWKKKKELKRDSSEKEKCENG